MKSLLLWFRTFSWLFITSASQPQTFNCSRSNGDFCIIISLDFFLIHFLMPVFILMQVLGSVPLPIFFRTSNFRASVLQKWLKSSHYKSHGWFNPDLGLVKCIEFSPVLFLLLITTELFCTSNDNTILINSQLLSQLIFMVNPTDWLLPWSCWHPSLCLGLFSQQQPCYELGFGFEFGKVTTATQFPWSWPNKSFATDLAAASRALFNF